MSSCPAAGSKAATVPEVERVWFLPRAATGTAQSEGSPRKAQGGLQAYCPCPLSQHRGGGTGTTMPVCRCCAGLHTPVPLHGYVGAPLVVLSVSLSHPWTHRFLTTHSRCLGSSQTTSPQCWGCQRGGSACTGCSCWTDPLSHLLVLGVSGPNPGITSHPAPSTAGHDWGEKHRNAKFEPRVEAVAPTDSEWPLQELVVPCHQAGTGTKCCCPQDDPGPAPAPTGHGNRVTWVAYAAEGHGDTGR